MPLAAGHSRGIVSSNIAEMVGAGHPQQQAVAAALSNARRHPRAARGGIVGYDTGGVPTLPDGSQPQNTAPVIPGLLPSNQTQNPLQSTQLAQYQNVPTEKLAELAASPAAQGPQGATIKRLLQQRRVQPNQPSSGIAPINPAQNQNVPPQLPTYDDGGGIDWEQGAKLASHFERPQSISGTTGFLHSAVPGRTDLIHAEPPAGSYVIPADVVSGVGEGNSLAGAALIQHALSTGPYGTPLPSGRSGGVRIPSPPARFTEPLMGPTAKRGGRTKEEEGVGKPTPILAAGGEFIISPEFVRLWGGGNMKRGHDLLDAWVVKKRNEIADKMKKLPGPKKG